MIPLKICDFNNKIGEEKKLSIFEHDNEYSTASYALKNFIPAKQTVTQR